MCGRYALWDKDQLEKEYSVDPAFFERPNYNVAPGQSMPIVKEGDSEVDIARWGLVPSWAKDISIGYRMINARAEGIESKPAYGRLLKNYRCSVPVNGFFEWKEVEKGKIPYYIHLKDRKLFSFAGLYTEREDAEGRPLKSYTIITTEPNSFMAKIHNRMPVILSKDSEKKWLDPDLVETDRIKQLLISYPASKMEAYPVSTLVNRPINNTSAVIQPDNAP